MMKTLWGKECLVRILSASLNVKRLGVHAHCKFESLVWPLKGHGFFKIFGLIFNWIMGNLGSLIMFWREVVERAKVASRTSTGARVRDIAYSLTWSLSLWYGLHSGAIRSFRWSRLITWKCKSYVTKVIHENGLIDLIVTYPKMKDQIKERAVFLLEKRSWVEIWD